MIITAVHIMQHSTTEYVGRAMRFQKLKGSVLENPFKVDHHGSRDWCIEKFDQLLEKEMEDIHSDQAIEMVRLATLAKSQGHLELGCWCCKTPKPVTDDPLICHTQIIGRKILKMLEVKDD
jgi:Domain of unknown function (DUF4326)